MATDCNDNDLSINPGLEQPSDGIDSNCDGAEAWYADYDNDGFRAMNGVVIDSIDADCDDPGEGAQFEPATDCMTTMLRSIQLLRNCGRRNRPRL